MMEKQAQPPRRPCSGLERFIDILFGFACKILTVTMAVGFLLDKLLDINLIKLF